MKKILLFTPSFNVHKNHGQIFIKTRINEYIKNGYKVNLVSLSKKKKIIKKNKLKILYFENYDGIKKYLFKNIYNFDKIFIHFITLQFIKILKSFGNLDINIWIHGIEGQSWKWYSFDKYLKPFWFFKHFIYNSLHIFFFKRFLRDNSHKIKLIFVSKWMKNVFIKDLNIKKNLPKNTVIPNPIDNIFFNKIRRLKKTKKNVLIVKNFSSYKYAGDITIDYLQRFSSSPLFKEFNFTIIGKGTILEKNIYKIKNFKNIKIIKRFIDNKHIFKYHKKNSIFIYLTRMDSQSVTLSEAIASGSVCISSKNTAIPEFVKNNYNGFLVDTYDEFLRSLVLLRNNFKIFEKFSNNSISISKNFKSEQIFSLERKFINL